MKTILFLFVLHMSKTLPIILDLISAFGKISGYTINNISSSILLLNGKEAENTTPQALFFEVVDHFIYLDKNNNRNIRNTIGLNWYTV